MYRTLNISFVNQKDKKNEEFYNKFASMNIEKQMNKIEIKSN